VIKPVDVHSQVSVIPHSPYTELHWVPRRTARARGGREARQDFAVVSARLGSRDWQSIDPVPVRVHAGVTRGRATPALYYWQRTAAHIWCESQTEKEEVMWLDFTGEVERLWSQPFAITFGEDVRGAGAWHVPDFLGVQPNGRLKLYDVRPAERIDDKARKKFDATRRVCELLGWPYEVLNGRDRDVTRVLSWVKASRHERCAPPVDAADRILFHAKNGATRRSLCQVASPECPQRANPWVDHLVWHRRLQVDLCSRYDSAAILRASGDAR